LSHFTSPFCLCVCLQCFQDTVSNYLLRPASNQDPPDLCFLTC
jgi:hypothetical protein